MASDGQARYVGAIDQGTTSTRFMIFDHDGNEVARHRLPHEQIRSRAGWVEHDPHEIWESTQDVVEAALGRAGITADDLAAIGIANQRETTVVWDRRTGVPCHHAIAGRDPRTEPDDSSGGRIQWILDNVDGVRADAEAGDAIFGTTDSWLAWWLTGGPDGGQHLTDVTNASRTALMDLETLDWDDELLARLDVPRSMLPEIRSSSEAHGRTVTDGPFGGEVAVAGVLGDRQATLVGQACFGPGGLTATYGPDRASLVLNAGTEIVRPGDGLITTVGYRLGAAPAVYALEGSVAMATDGPETIWHRTRDMVRAMAADTGLEPSVLHVDGGLAADEPAMQALADVLGMAVSRPVVAETAALGAAYAAGLAVGFWADPDELRGTWREAQRWEPA
jgi:glycerol kinase